MLYEILNTLPSYVIDSTDFDNFKTNLDNYFNFYL